MKQVSRVHAFCIPLGYFTLECYVNSRRKSCFPVWTTDARTLNSLNANAASFSHPTESPKSLIPVLGRELSLLCFGMFAVFGGTCESKWRWLASVFLLIFSRGK